MSRRGLLEVLHSKTVALVTLGGLLAAVAGVVGVEVRGPNAALDALEERVEEHIGDFEQHLAQMDSSDMGTRLDGITRLMCVRTGRDTLELANMIRSCEAVGVSK